MLARIHALLIERHMHEHAGQGAEPVQPEPAVTPTGRIEQYTRAFELAAAREEGIELRVPIDGKAATPAVI